MSASIYILSKEHNKQAYAKLYKFHVRAITQPCLCCCDFLGENSSHRKKRKGWKSWKTLSKSNKQFSSKLSCKNLKYNIRFKIFNLI